MRHSCCVGWEIAIDPDKLVYYRSIEGEFGARLQKGIAEADDAAQFILDDEERCPFLNRTGIMRYDYGFGGGCALSDLPRPSPFS